MQHETCQLSLSLSSQYMEHNFVPVISDGFCDTLSKLVVCSVAVTNCDLENVVVAHLRSHGSYFRIICTKQVFLCLILLGFFSFPVLTDRGFQQDKCQIQ